MMRAGRLGLAAAASAALVGAGCGGGTVIDTSKIEAQAQSELEKTLPQRLQEGKPGKELQESLQITDHEKVSSVDCPSNVDVEPTQTFACTVTFANGQKATETFEIRNKDADVTAISLRPAK